MTPPAGALPTKPPAPQDRAPRLAAIILWTLALAVGGYHLVLEVMTLRLPEPMGIWETAYASEVRIWPHQYQPGHFVEGFDPYGPGYPATVRPFLALGMGTYPAHRLASLLALLGASALLAWTLRRRGIGSPTIAAVVAIVVSLNAGSYSIQARPDFLVLLQTLGLLLVAEAQSDPRDKRVIPGLLWGLLGAAAYLTKPYTAVLFGYGLLHALIGRARGSVLRACLAGVSAAAVVALYGWLNPLYWLDTFQFHQTHSALDWHWLVSQTRDFTVLACGLVVLGLGLALSRTGRSFGMRFWSGSFLAGSLALGLGLGWHMGSYLTYFYHLVLPQLAVLAALSANRVADRATKLVGPALLAGNCVVLLALAPALPKADPSWAALSADIGKAQGPVLCDWLMEPFLGTRADLSLTGTGLTPVAVESPYFLSSEIPSVRQTQQEVSRFEEGLHTTLRSDGRPKTLYLEGITRHYGPEQVAYVHKGQPSLLLIPYTGPDGKPVVFIQRGNMGAFQDDILNHYVPVAFFVLRPYYLSTNEPRQAAGSWTTVVLKLAEK